MRRNQRSDEAEEWRKLYHTARWQSLRSWQLNRQPLCERCKAKGITAAATVCNHRIPHKGDPALFYDPDNLEPLCAPCHDGPVQSEERLGYSKEVGLDGWPICPSHPANKGEA